MGERTADVTQLARGEAECALGRRDDRPVPVLLAFGDGSRCERDGAAWVRAREVDRVVCFAARRGRRER